MQNLMKKIHRLLIWFFIFLGGLFLPSQIQALRALFRPTDLLPVLPRGVSTPVLNYFNSAADLLPAFVGAATVFKNNLEWKAACFNQNTAWLELHNKSKSQLGGGTLHIKVSRARSWTCLDIYAFASPYRLNFDYYFKSGEHTLEFDEWASEAEYKYVKDRGISVFLMQAGMLGTLRSLWDVFPLFTNTGWSEEANLEFLKRHMGASFEERPKPARVTNVNPDDIHSGDFLVLSKIRGRWGGFQALQKWVTGSYAGHTAVCLRDPQGKLWVAESGTEDEDGRDMIAVIPWEDWWEFELTKDQANPHIGLLPLHLDVRAKFNETAAWEFAQSMNGKSYGYHNLIFSWIDTVKDNYPPPLDARLVAAGMTFWSQIQPSYAANLWNEALNKRLGTEGLSLPEILVEVEKRGSSFAELLAIPEQDDWLYSDGKSTMCVAYVIQIYKEAGIFGNLTSFIQATEFTVKDAYILKIFEDDLSRLPPWCNAGDTVKLPFCQIRGKYRMELPGYNTMEPYPNMNENCPSLPPRYDRPKGC